MTVTVVEGADRSQWRIEVSDEPQAVLDGAKMLTEQVQAGMRGIPSEGVLQAWLKSARAQGARDDNRPTDAMRKALHAMANDLLLDRDDRLALAEVTLDRDIESWSELTYEEARRLLDKMSGYVEVRHLRQQKRTSP